MRKVNMCLAVFATWFSIVPGAALGQGTAGSIAGTVRDGTGGVLPGVTVEASSPALIEKVRSVATDETGQYPIVDLRPGTYTVTFTLPGFNALRREGIELTTGFTAAVNADLSLGDVAETVTVTGESPVVDIQNTQRQVVMTREVIDAIPTSRNPAGLGNLIPGITLSNSRNAGNSAQDVGGSGGFNAVFSTSMSIHGGRVTDQQLQIDGMPVLLWSNITLATTFMSDGNFEEVAIDVSGNAAEIESGGVRINMIPREGGNTFRGKVFAAFSDPNFQATNISETLKQQGLGDANRLKTMWQYNPSLGGPVVRDKLWFFTSFARQRSENYIAGSYFNTDLTAWNYVPDPTRQAADETYGWDAAVRMTWQATPRNKIGAFSDYNKVCQCTQNLVAGAETVDAANIFRRKALSVQLTWSAPVTNRVLFEAGVARAEYPATSNPQPGAVAPQIIDTGLNKVYRNLEPSKSTYTQQKSFVARGSVSYVTGTHAMKVGFRSLTGSFYSTYNYPPHNVSFEALNGVPTQVTYYGIPGEDIHYLRPNLGVYGQDQWTLQRLTMNLGVPFDYLRPNYPDQFYARSQWVPVDRSAPGQVAIRWKDLSPRLGLSYDLFGNAKTALKLSVGRFVLAEGLRLAEALNPILANNSNSRSWTDTNNDRIVQGDPFNPVANSELGPSTNLKFGQPESTLMYDPDWAFGFGKRPNNWEYSLSVQHELLPQVAVSAGYFRRTFGNQSVIDNQAVTGADFDPYCVTTPVDPRLPGGGNQEICGLYDLKASKVGQLQRVRTKASNYGDLYEHWNGVDVTMSARLPRLLLQGGVSAGKTTADNCALATHPQVVATAERGMLWLTTGPSTPSQYCHVDTPLAAQTQVKLLGSYTLPWDVQLAGTFQQLPGPPERANATFRSAQIAPSLGRSLAAASTVRVQIVPPDALYGDRLNQFDLRLGKTFAVQSARLKGMIDVYNVFNSNVVTLRSGTYGATTGSAAGAPWLVPQGIMLARLFKLSVQMDF